MERKVKRRRKQGKVIQWQTELPADLWSYVMQWLHTTERLCLSTLSSTMKRVVERPGPGWHTVDFRRINKFSDLRDTTRRAVVWLRGSCRELKCTIEGAQWDVVIRTCIVQLPQLRRLFLPFVRVDEFLLQCIASLTRLEVLCLELCSIDATLSFAPLARLKRLHTLKLSFSDLKAQQLRTIINSMRSLTSLDIGDCNGLTVDGLETISTTPFLRSLNMCSCINITREESRRLADKLCLRPFAMDYYCSVFEHVPNGPEK